MKKQIRITESDITKMVLESIEQINSSTNKDKAKQRPKFGRKSLEEAIVKEIKLAFKK